MNIFSHPSQCSMVHERPTTSSAGYPVMRSKARLTEITVPSVPMIIRPSFIVSTMRFQYRLSWLSDMEVPSMCLSV